MALLALCLGVANVPAAGAGPNASNQAGTPADFVRAVLPYAASDFSALRGPKIESGLPDSVYGAYQLRVSTRVCSACRIYDNFGRGTSPEFWNVANIYQPDPSGADELVTPTFSTTPLPAASPVESAPPGAEVPPPGALTTPQPEWPIEKTEAYVRAQLTPLLTGFSMRRILAAGMTGEKVPTLLWRGPHKVWVEARMYPHMAAGLVSASVVVGHDLTKSKHILSAPTRAQLAQMQSGVRRFIRAALAPARENFSSLRGPIKNEDIAGHDYRVTATFGPAIRSCEILDIAARMGQSWSRTSEPAWAMLCSTAPVLGTRAKLETIVRSAIAAALPTSFTGTANAKLHGYDYLWTSQGGVAVAIDWGSPNEDVVSFTVRVMRFSPKS